MMNYTPPNMLEPNPSSSDNIKVPPNAFAIYMKEQHNIVSMENPNLSENDVCRLIGRMWLVSTDEFKEKYRIEAKQLREKFKIENPSFTEKILKKKKPKSESIMEPHPITVKVIIDNENLAQEQIHTNEQV